ncbi:cation diffusion facilitator CzcD-associated flavoprotein CzcO [Amycolatopsis lexingtonensis]|uniref:Cation diffusion facilitator CzcD-associated flavoprotein CzcO n=1 Tax=Amycolatopsis lexingtonensis TaxID=218822 RepID=A0ABR9HYL3_9PSEU|nr:NAD(P)/FAD-dependent oxidoreductase [Amycolatopsis lexingtonensis]MBE1496022.1 cation diffusion facilitator CzcD-associated flavoprotein CzcO [Amycolatopsis lexingtonensis]
MTNAPPRRVRVAIIGAGFGGLATAIALKRAGIDDFVMLERAGDVGGTWQVNTYPGAQCDIPSILYSFSFAPNPRWSRLYPLQPEIHEYLRQCTEDFGITPHLRLRHEVREAAWDDAAAEWQIRTDHGDWTAQILVGAIGPFSEPAVPDLPGLARFRGTTFHSSAWDHDHDLAGRRIAVIGTGASAVQIIPRIQPAAARLTVFQRTPTWIMPHPDRPLGDRSQRLFDRAPAVQRLARTGWDLLQEALVPGLVHRPWLLKGLEAVSLGHLRRQVRDPRLRAKLTPSYAFGCKRPTFSNAYYPALAAPNVDVVTDAIREITPEGIRTADGVEHEVDTIVFGTGFRMTDHPGFGRIHGRGGRSLAEVWAGSPRAYLGTTVAGFPNFFLMLGPNSVVYTSQVVTIEAQVAYVLSCLAEMDRSGLSTVEVREDVQEGFVREVDRGLSGSVWNTGGCRSYYLDPTGRNFVFYPGFNRRFRARTRQVDLADYHLGVRLPQPTRTA